MIVRLPHHVVGLGIFLTLPLTAAGAAAANADLSERASLTITDPSVSLAARCDLHAALATVRLRADNHANTASSERQITVLDTAHALAGRGDVPELAPHESRWIDVPLPLDAGIDPSPAAGPAAIAGAHTFDVYLSERQSKSTRLTTPTANVATTIPTAFCTPSTPVRSSKSFGNSKVPGPSLATTTVRPVVPLIVATPNPRFGVVSKQEPFTLPVGIPQGLRAANSIGDCEAHAQNGFGQFGNAVACPSMMSGGNLVLIWDVPTDPSVDGYHLYSLVGDKRIPAVGILSGRARTLAKLPPLTSGPIPQCYVVTATRGSSESLAGPAYCAREATATITLGTTYTKFSWKDSHQGSGFSGADSLPDGPVVGYLYTKNKSVLGDTAYDKIRRYAVAFDVDALRNKRLISARLHLTIASSYGAGNNNHSCATTVASGNEFWWKSDAQTWVDGTFGDSAATFGDTGPVVTADVTKLVAAIMAGSPNYGFVIRNNYEDLNAFLNAQCETIYSSPQLEIDYYN